MAVRRHFNALGVTESDVIVDWLYKSKHQGTARTQLDTDAMAHRITDKEFRVRFAPQRK
jgi:histone deacetylase complex subunit SAP30